MFLEKINSPADLKKLNIENLNQYTRELRDYLIDVMSKNGGHVAANLGVVELTVALHYVFDTPNDILVWDVGHQSYAHKTITGRRNQLQTLRQLGGISGFTSRTESVYDAFGAGHSSTSLSAAGGFAEGLWQKKSKNLVLAVVGDGALTAGLAFEGLNFIGHLRRPNTIIVLNDNDMSISENVGWARQENIHKKNYFQNLGFEYAGPVDGHDLKSLVEHFINWKVKLSERIARRQAHEADSSKPLLLHIKTKKGKGFKPAEDHPEVFHGVSGFDTQSGLQKKKPLTAKSYTEVFSQTVSEMAADDPNIVAVTAAMPTGTGLSLFQERFPERFYDVGIAEGHAVTFAAGLRLQGLKPVVAVYSTFLQRGFDQLIHDVAIQNIPVAFFLDRAGLVGADGATHQGAFDLSYLRLIPNFVLMAPKDENELRHMINTALNLDSPSAVRFSRGSGLGVKLDSSLHLIPVGKSETVFSATGSKKKIVIWAVGATVQPSIEAAQRLNEKGFGVEVVNTRFIKPLDEEALLSSAVGGQSLIVTVEENTVIGGLGAAVLECLAKHSQSNQVLNLGLPDRFIPHGEMTELRHALKLDAEGLVEAIEKRAGR